MPLNRLGARPRREDRDVSVLHAGCPRETDATLDASVEESGKPAMGEPWVMDSVLVFFGCRPCAYAFLSELRRRSDGMLWDARVRLEGEQPAVVVPAGAWRRDRSLAGLARDYGGTVRPDERRRARHHRAA